MRRSRKDLKADAKVWRFLSLMQTIAIFSGLLINVILWCCR